MQGTHLHSVLQIGPAHRAICFCSGGPGGGGSETVTSLTFTTQQAVDWASAQTRGCAVRSLFNMIHCPKFRKGCDSNSK